MFCVVVLGLCLLSFDLLLFLLVGEREGDEGVVAEEEDALIDDFRALTGRCENIIIYIYM